MRGEAPHLTLVIGEPAKAEQLKCALHEHGIQHAAVVARLDSMRRSLVLGENDFVIVCIALDRQSIGRHGESIRSLLSDNGCFPTRMRTVGLLSELGLTREAAELGCDLYVEDSAEAADAIRRLSLVRETRSGTSRPRLRIHGGWMFGSPNLPNELMSLVPNDAGGHETDLGDHPPRRIDRSGEEFGGPRGLR